MTQQAACWEQYSAHALWAWQASRQQSGLLYSDESTIQNKLANECAREAKRKEQMK
jgi:hypothetical protein